MNHHIKRFLFKYYALVAVTIFVGALLLFVFGILTWETLIAVELGVMSFAFGVQKQHIEETKLFKELFREFNEHYNRLNEKLNTIFQDPQTLEVPFKPDERDALYDYFNLCAEEFFYFHEGFICQEVWNSWKNGMKFFRRNPRIKKLWDDDLNEGSYYGLEFGSGENNDYASPC